MQMVAIPTRPSTEFRRDRSLLKLVVAGLKNKLEAGRGFTVISLNCNSTGTPHVP